MSIKEKGNRDMQLHLFLSSVLDLFFIRLDNTYKYSLVRIYCCKRIIPSAPLMLSLLLRNGVCRCPTYQYWSMSTFIIQAAIYE